MTSANHRRCLEAVRRCVHGLLPDVEEVIAYGIPTFRYRGKNLLHMSSSKNHCSLHPGSEVIVAFASDLADFKTSKGTIRFTERHEIPTELLARIIRARQLVIDQAQ
jgi:uncharacterized protein YdhG (YjbR/CyaY superfamily)